MLSPTLSFIIIEYHSEDDVKDCIASIKQRCEGLDYEIIVSSNSCYPPIIQFRLERENPDAKWNFNVKNGGFAYAMNQGLKVACGRYVAIINPDVRIKSELSPMIDFMTRHPFVGAIAPLIVNKQGVIQDSARKYVSVHRYIWRCLKRIITRKSSIMESGMDYSRVQTVDWVIGAFILVRKEAYEKTNGMDESYFMYAEDLDWCTRIRTVGYEIVYFPLVKVEYEGSRSARRSLKYARIFLKSHLHYWKKFGFFSGYPKRKTLVQL